MTSNFEQALVFLLKHEGGYYKDDREESNMGITRKFLDSIGMKDQTVRSLTPNQVHEIYKTHFWDRYKLDQVQSHRIAEKMLDMMVNMGPVTAAVLIQCTVNGFGFNIPNDGAFGPLTRSAINGVLGLADGENRLLGSLRPTSVTHYQKLAAANPKLQKFLKGWEARANA